jgi:hypothetical protein
VRESEPLSTHREEDALGELAEPGAVYVRSVGESVVVADLRVVVVAWVGVAALTVVQGVADAVVVVALDRDDVGVAEDFSGAIRVWTKATNVTKAEDLIGAGLTRVFEDGGESEVVAVDTAEDRDAAGFRLPTQVEDSRGNGE